MERDERIVATQAQKILTQVRKVIVGKDYILVWALAAMLAKGEKEEYDSLWEEEEKGAEEPSPSEVAAEKEIAISAPESVAAAAAAAVSGEE